MEKSRFSSVEKILGTTAMPVLATKRVSIIGLGGVGSWTAEALARTGIGHLQLVDLDDICISNTNRQVHALEPNYGRYKIDALAERLKAINPEIQLDLAYCFASSKNLDELFAQKPDLVVDAMDSVKDKTSVFEYCRAHQIELVMSGASGGKTDPTLLRVVDLGCEEGDVLLKAVKKKLSKAGLVINKEQKNRPFYEVDVVYSIEKSIAPWDVCAAIAKPTKGPKAMDCNTGFGSLAYATGAFGFALASLAVKKLLLARN